MPCAWSPSQKSTAPALRRWSSCRSISVRSTTLSSVRTSLVAGIVDDGKRRAGEADVTIATRNGDPAPPLIRLRHLLPSWRGEGSRRTLRSSALLPACGEKVPKADEGLCHLPAPLLRSG